MGRRPCCEKVGLNRGGWTASEDQTLIAYIKANGEGKWRDLPKLAGLKRCGKSCRLRWLNYLNPEIRRGNITQEEEDLIITLHKHLGNRWSLIAGKLPGRTDNEIKNYWNTILHKKVQGHHQSSSTRPKRKPRKKSNIDRKNSTDPPGLVSPTTTNIPQSMPSQENSTEMGDEATRNIIDIQTQTPQSSGNAVPESGSGDSYVDVDDYLQFLLNVDVNTLTWDEDVYDYQDVSSEAAFTSVDPMFDYWRENTLIDQDITFEESGSFDALFESNQWP